MQDFQQRKKVRRKLYSRNAVIILAIVTIFLVRGAYEVMQKKHQSEVALLDAQSELKEAQAHEAELAADRGLLDSDAGVEREIREKYSVAKPGEHVAIIVDTAPTTTATTTQPESVWTKIGNWFKKVF